MAPHEREYLKCLLLYNSQKNINKSFNKVISEAKFREEIMISAFKYPNLTVLKDTTFACIKNELENSIPLIKQKKTMDTIDSQYNLLFIIQLL
jgi:hypothetical protein